MENEREGKEGRGGEGSGREGSGDSTTKKKLKCE